MLYPIPTAVPSTPHTQPQRQPTCPCPHSQNPATRTPHQHHMICTSHTPQACARRLTFSKSVNLPRCGYPCTHQRTSSPCPRPPGSTPPPPAPRAAWTASKCRRRPAPAPGEGPAGRRGEPGGVHDQYGGGGPAGRDPLTPRTVSEMLACTHGRPTLPTSRTASATHSEGVRAPNSILP